jgi:hypothetical protein
MLTLIAPKLPMRNKAITRQFYVNQLGFTDIGAEDYEGYLLLKKNEVEIHFFEHRYLDPKENYGQVYIRTNEIDVIYNELKSKDMNCSALEAKPWKQKEFCLLDPDHNLLTFGQAW